ncbi:MAG: DUF302 domain-containing protein [Bacteroidetes bacterium]|nr:DUF302 domain-containing protein [Bacteroidota bacterium]
MTQTTSTVNPTTNTFTYQVSGTKPITAAIALVGAASEQFKFSVLHSYDFFEILQTKGFPIERKVHVFEICRAPMASKMLTAFPGFATFMPCRIAVYEENGETVVSTMNMEPLLKMVEGNPELFKEAAAMYQSIQSVMNALLA